MNGSQAAREALLDELARIEVAEAAADGDPETQGEMLHRAAVLLTLLGQDDEAIARVERAIALHTRHGGLQELSQDHNVIALLLARKGRTDEAKTHLEDAAAGFNAVGNRKDRGRALVHLATLALGAGAVEDAGDLCREAATELAEAGEARLVVHALQLWTVILQLQRKPADAYAVMARSVEIARRTGLDDELLDLRVALYDLSANPLVDKALRPESIEALLADASDEPATRATIHLTRGSERYQGGDLDGAWEDAQAARQSALQGPDPIGYLLACLFLAELAEKKGDRLGVLTILMTCQASLGDLLGDEARAPVVAVIESLRKRWGDRAFEAEMTRHRAQFD